MQPIVRDLKNDDKLVFEKNKDGYIFTVKVTYDNDTKLVKQKIYLDKDLNLTKVEVLDKLDDVKMRLTVLEYNLKESFDDKYFELNDSYEEETKDNKKEIKNNENKEQSKNDNKEQNNNPENNNTSEQQSNGTSDKKENNDELNQDTQSSSKIEEVVYPMYLPVNTYLSNQDTIPTEAGERVIMTFAGETPFLLVQETAKKNNTTDFVNGDPYLILDTIGAVTDYSVSWINNGIEYNVVSDSMNVDQLITVAESISTVAIGK